MDTKTTEQIYKLVKQGYLSRDPSKASEAFRQMSIISGYISQDLEPSSEKQHKYVPQWLQKNYLNVYLWATGKLYIGHPATVWGGMRVTNSHSAMPKIS